MLHKATSDFGVEKLEWRGYSPPAAGEKSLRIMFTRFDRIHKRNRHPDGQTERDRHRMTVSTVPCLCIASVTSLYNARVTLQNISIIV